MRIIYTIIRIDGIAFHTYTKGLAKPFDKELIEDMNNTSIYLCENIMGAKMGFVQSDEISIILTDFDALETQPWFDGTIQKIVSVVASMATARFNQLRMNRILNKQHDTIAASAAIIKMKLAEFDARVFQVPTRGEVINYLIWRQQDAIRNSISSVAQNLYSHKELNKVNTNKMQELIFQKGINWNNYSPREKHGGVIRKIHNIDSLRSNWVEDIYSPEFLNNFEYYNNIIPENQ
jgi:tRNA(His) 5'-end guanylyltransferase